MLTRVFLTLLCLGITLNILWISETAFFGDNVWRDMRSLRKGEAIQFEKDLCGGYNFRERASLHGRPFPNGEKICGRLNFQKKMLEVSTGEVLYVGDDPHFFPSSKAEREAVELDESFQSNHPITSVIQKFYKENTSALWIIFGVVFAIYFCWRLLKFIIRELFFTATKAIEDAKNRNYGER